MALKALRAVSCAVILASLTTASSMARPAEKPGADSARYPLIFDRVPTAFAVETFFRRVSRAPFVLCSEVLEDRRPVTLRLSPEHVNLQSFSVFLQARGYRAFERGGLFIVCGTGAQPVGLSQQDEDRTKAGGSSTLTPELTRHAPQAIIDPAQAKAPRLPAASGVQAPASTPPLQATGVYRTRFRPAHELAQIARPLLPDVRVITPGEEVRTGDVRTPPGGEIAYAGDANQVEALLSLLASLDTRPASVEIQAVLVEVTRSRNDSWGIEVVGELLRNQLGIAVSAERGAQQLEFRFGDVSALLSALAGDARVDVLSAPFVSAENGRRTELTVGEEVPVLGAVVATGDGGTQQSVDYRSSGVILQVVPRVYREALFIDLQQEVSSFARTQTGVNNSPTLTKRNLTTSLEVPEGSWVALGGLVSDRVERSDERLFPRGPRIGQRDTRGQAELVLLVRVVRRQDQTT